MKRCEHPESERWQARGMWFCCACWKWFWGDKRQPVPEKTIYGDPA